MGLATTIALEALSGQPPLLPQQSVASPRPADKATQRATQLTTTVREERAEEMAPQLFASDLV